MKRPPDNPEFARFTEVVRHIMGVSKATLKIRRPEVIGLLDLKGIVVRRLILLMRRREEIGPRSGFPQVKINGNFFPVSIAGCASAALSQ